MKLYPVPTRAAGRISLCERPDPDELAQDARTLAGCGVSLVVSLLPVAEERAARLEAEADALHTCGIGFERIPTPDFDVPVSEVHASATLLALADSLSQPATHIAVHCAAGLGRSPTIVAALLVLLGATPDGAWRTVTMARGREVPETESQRLWPGRFGERPCQSD